ncbi:MAG TPA: hypothetical protein VGC72_01915 [Candidatus Elarobacter sp.]|jgi:hypothetical protein
MDALKPVRTPRAKTLFAWLSLGLLVISLVVPIAEVPFVGSLNVFSLQDGTAYWFLGFAIVAALAIFAKYFRLLAIPGVLVVGMTLLYAYHLEQTKAELADSMRGNIFSGLASAASASIHLQWGIALLIIAGVALVLAGFLRSDADTLPQLFAANRLQLIEAGIALAVLFIGIALLPHVVPRA